MRFRTMGLIVCLVGLGCIGGPLWGQELPRPIGQPPTPQNDAASKAADEAPEVRIEDAVICHDVVDRMPVGSNDVFSGNPSKLYCFCRVVGAQPGAKIVHNWYNQNGLKASVELEVRSTGFRTWSSKSFLPGSEGEWMVEILSETGKPLESIIFVIE